jgi:hypothetical protein
MKAPQDSPLINGHDRNGFCFKGPVIRMERVEACAVLGLVLGTLRVLTNQYLLLLSVCPPVEHMRHKYFVLSLNMFTAPKTVFLGHMSSLV